MRYPALALALACGAACAHGRPGATSPVPGAEPQLVVPDRIETVAVFELRTGHPEADRLVGDFTRQALLVHFDDLRTTACVRAARLVLVPNAPGGHATEEITYGGAEQRVRFFYGRQRLEGIEIPC